MRRSVVRRSREGFGSVAVKSLHIVVEVGQAGQLALWCTVTDQSQQAMRQPGQREPSRMARRTSPMTCLGLLVAAAILVIGSRSCSC